MGPPKFNKKRKFDEKAVSSYWSITINDWDFKNPLPKISSKRYISGELEFAPTTGHKHLQLFYYTKKAYDFETTAAWIQDTFQVGRPHLRMLDDMADARYIYWEYTQKDFDNKVPGAYQIFIGNSEILPAELLCPYVQKLKEDKLTVFPKRVDVIIGRKKIGKTRMCKIIAEYLGPDSLYNVPGTSGNSQRRWLSGYAGQPIVCMEEFRKGDFEVDFWKQFLDVHPQQLTTTQGGKSVLFRPQLIFLFGNSTDGEQEISDETLIVETQKKYSWIKNYKERLDTCSLSFLTESPLYKKQCVFNF